MLKLPVIRLVGKLKRWKKWSDAIATNFAFFQTAPNAKSPFPFQLCGLKENAKIAPCLLPKCWGFRGIFEADRPSSWAIASLIAMIGQSGRLLPFLPRSLEPDCFWNLWTAIERHKFCGSPYSRHHSLYSPVWQSKEPNTKLFEVESVRHWGELSHGCLTVAGCQL